MGCWDFVVEAGLLSKLVKCDGARTKLQGWVTNPPSCFNYFTLRSGLAWCKVSSVIKDRMRAGWVLPLLVHATAGVCGAGAAEPAFTDVTKEVGGLSGYTTVHPYTAPHAAWGDFDNDGWVDIFQGSLGYEDRPPMVCGVWRNVGGKKFELAAELPPDCLAAIWGDYDNDGFLDLYCWSTGQLFQNQRRQSFKEVPMPEGHPKQSRGACWGDYDGDGWLDLYVSGFEVWPDQEFADVIFHNLRGKSFELGWQQKEIKRGRGVTAADFDEDGDLDLYVSNYRLQPNLLWINDGTGSFSDQATAYGAAGDGEHGQWGHTISSAFGDFDSDGLIDLFVGNFSHPPKNQDRVKLLRNTGSAGGFKFDDQGPTAAPEWQESFASPTLGDFDNDGFLDFYLTTVYEGGKSVLYRNTSADFSEMPNPNSKPGESPVGKWRFQNVTDEAGVITESTYGAAWADYDNDGDLDLAAGARLFQNLGNENHWLKLRLDGGPDANRGSIGARILVHAGPWKLVRQVEGGTGEGNQNDLAVHFGLGSRGDPVKVIVHWSNGDVQTFETPVDRIVDVVKQAVER